MHRQRFSSVPTEILRSVVSVSEAGSISKAAKSLGISQPAISAQMKRIEDIVGGPIFLKTANGSIATELGKLVLIQARKILEANQQMLLLRGARDEHRSLRLGLNYFHAIAALRALRQTRLDDVSMVVNSASEIVQGLLNGYIDLAVLMRESDADLDPTMEVLLERPVEFAWVRTRDFVLSPGAPIPLLTWGGQTVHRMMVNALERQGLIYRIAFSSPDPSSRIEAASCGLGLTVLPRDDIPSSLVEAREQYLPQLSAGKLFLVRRSGSNIAHDGVVTALRDGLFQPGTDRAHKMAG